MICKFDSCLGLQENMNLLTKYFDIQHEIFEYFGYREDWRRLPLDDCRDCYWEVNDREVVFANGNTPEEAIENVRRGDYYSNEIYTQRHLPKWVYRGKEYTLICVDTQTDGNKLLSVFSNAKETTNLCINA